jgi:protein-tyrosine phosphatase
LSARPQHALPECSAENGERAAGEQLHDWINKMTGFRSLLRGAAPSWLMTFVRAARSAEVRDDLRHEFRRRRNGEPALPAGQIQKIVVICHGNICRSPFAGIDLATRNAGVKVRSAGLAAGTGNPAEPGARRAARNFDIELINHASQPFTDEDVEWADMILAMQGRHFAAIRRRWPEATDKVRLLGDYLQGSPHAIEDPWGQDDEIFESVFCRIVRANERLSELLREGTS